jgi:hypothetical protein
MSVFWSTVTFRLIACRVSEQPGRGRLILRGLFKRGLVETDNESVTPQIRVA